MVKLKFVLNEEKKLNASTLVEVLVALVIIMIAFVFGISMFVKITNSSMSLNQIMINKRMEYHLKELPKDTLLLDDTWIEDSVVYERKIELFKDYKDVKKVSISAIKQGELIGKMDYLLVNE
jgi:hypothetical protein